MYICLVIFYFMTPEQRFICMSHNRAKNTGPELQLRHVLWRLGFRYHVNVKRLPGSPDIVLPKYRTVIFVHGCFWHGHKDCKNASTPKTNTAFWTAKIQRNQQRDQEVWRQLEAKGWSVIIVWECQLKKAVLNETISRVEAEILRSGEIFQSAQEDRRKAQEAYRQEMKARRERENAFKKSIR
jgi:DNA mismatch endonuclease (patch repair protein)